MKSKTDIRTLSEKELNARLVRDLTEVCPAGEREALAAYEKSNFSDMIYPYGTI